MKRSVAMMSHACIKWSTYDQQLTARLLLKERRQFQQKSTTEQANYRRCKDGEGIRRCQSRRYHKR